MSGFKIQVGGDHYTKLKIQPMQYSMENGLDALQHTIIKYVTRFRDKGGIEDLQKAKHCINMLMQHETGWTQSEIDKAAFKENWTDAGEERAAALMQNGPTAEHYAEMDDPSSWRVGDTVQFMDADCELYSQYGHYEIIRFTNDRSEVVISCDVPAGHDAFGAFKPKYSYWKIAELGCFQWVRRPSDDSSD